MTQALSKKDAEFLEESLHAPMWRMILRMGFPLALYQTLQQLFTILDTMMASHISAESVSAVAYIGQLNQIILAVGTGLSVGAGILISRAFGEGDLPMVKKRVSTLYAICLTVGLLILSVLLPFSGPFLRFAGTPEELITAGQAYFHVQLFVIVITFLDNVYIAVERARGNAKRILRLNLLCILVKLSLTAAFVYILQGDIVMIAYASLASQGLMLLFAIKNSLDRDSIFSFHVHAVSLEKKVSLPMILTSVPVMLEKILFSFGKSVVNAMAVGFGPLTVGALGVSNNLGGITTQPQAGFQDGASAIISQNEGAGKPERVLAAYRATLWICMLIGFVISGIELLFLRELSALFASQRTDFQELIMLTYRWEALAAVPLGANCGVMALLYGLGKTKHTMVINVSRVFLFRIPVFYWLKNYTEAGAESCGLVMFISNVLTAALSLVIVFFVIREYKKKHFSKG